MNHRWLLGLAPILSLLLLAGCQASGDVLFPNPDARSASDSSGITPEDAFTPPEQDATFTYDSPIEQDAAFTYDVAPIPLDAPAPLDAPLDGPLSCTTAPTIMAQDYDSTCNVDDDCVEVPRGGSACSPCAFMCNGATALTKNGAAAFIADYQAALQAYAAFNAQKVCAGACLVEPGPCCRNRACVAGAACLADAQAPVDATPE
jgi:hypothetical protein